MAKHDDDVEIYFIPFEDEYGYCIDMWTNDGWEHRVYLIEDEEYGSQEKIRRYFFPVEDEK